MLNKVIYANGHIYSFIRSLYQNIIRAKTLRLSLQDNFTKDNFCVMIGCITSINMAYLGLSFLSNVKFACLLLLAPCGLSSLNLHLAKCNIQNEHNKTKITWHMKNHTYFFIYGTMNNFHIFIITNEKITEMLKLSAKNFKAVL